MSTLNAQDHQIKCFNCQATIPTRSGKWGGEPIEFFPVTCPNCGADIGLDVIKHIIEAEDIREEPRL